jgi:glucosamine--fructose-6-phosphate aminotransferase (isomerizing)
MPELFGDKAYGVFKQIDSVLILACGTSYYAGLTAKYWLSRLQKSPSMWKSRVNTVTATACRIRTLVVTISQSGETADTWLRSNMPVRLGMEHTLTICNVSTSAMVRECVLSYITRAGIEVGVASTKAFTTQLVALFY